MRSLKHLLKPLLTLGMLACSLHVMAAPPAPAVKYGHAVSEADLKAWNIDINTRTGAGLPAGRGTAAAGKPIFEAKCAACHGAEAKGGAMFGSMVGGIGSFTTDKRILTPGSMFPYAPILYDYINRAMPMDRPQSLKPDEVYALSAYILHLNGLVGPNEEMNQKTLVQVKMPNRDNFIVDKRPDTQAKRCMKNCLTPQ